MINILFIWEVRKELQDYLRRHLKDISNLNLIFPNKNEIDNKSFPMLAECQIMIGWRPSREMLNSAKNLKLLLNPGAGVQHILPLIKEVNKNRKLIFCNGHGNAYFTAQHAIALLLSLSNRLLLHHQLLKEGQWRSGDKQGKSLPLRNKKIGLLGYGNINQNIHLFLSTFGCQFNILKRSWSNSEQQELASVNCFTPKQLHPFLEQSDILIVAVPHTDKTDGMIGKKELERLGENALLVNVARGAVIDERALYEALKNKVIHSAAIDVWYDYKAEKNEAGKRYPYRFPFHELDNILLSPHRAASPFDDLGRWNEVVENIKRFVAGETLLNVVDLELGY